MLTYLEREPFLARFYMAVLRENIFFMKFPSYKVQYAMMRQFIRRTFPFSFLKEGNRAVQVGSAAWTLEGGVSQTLMLSAVVGPQGHVLVIEPEGRNVEALKAYIRKNGIFNISVLKNAVGKEAGKAVLVVYEGASGAHVFKETLEEKEEYKRRRGITGGGRPSKEEEVEADTLDSILESVEYSPDFVNVTTNGSEFDVIKGMEETLRGDVSVVFPMWGAREWFPEALSYLSVRGYDVVACDAPPTYRGPGIEGMRRPYRTRSMVPQRLLALGTRRRGVPLGNRECEAAFEAGGAGGDIVVVRRRAARIGTGARAPLIEGEEAE